MKTILVGTGTVTTSLATAALAASVAQPVVDAGGYPIKARKSSGPDSLSMFPAQKPDNRGRRAEKDAIALKKAEAKRQRKAAKKQAKT